MNGIKASKWRLAVVATVVSLTFSGWSYLASASPLVLSKAPLYVGSGVQPNVLFLLDDSGSMAQEVSMTQGARILAKAIHDETDVPLFNDAFNFDTNQVDLSPDDLQEYLKVCSGYNALGYNPNVIYTPWETFGDAVYPNMWKDPTNQNEGTVSISGVKYVEWNDTGVAGYFELGECSVTREDGPDGIQYTYDETNLITPTTDSDKQNYANWYTYHRSRDYLFKRALSGVFMGLQTRAAVATINANAGLGWGMEMKDVDDISNPSNADDPDTAQELNKAELLSTLFQVSDEGGIRHTPLRRALENAGRYFLGDYDNYTVQEGFVTASGQPSDPLLAEDAGGSCQQNHTILATDGYRNESRHEHYIVGNYSNADLNTDNAYDGGLYADSLSNTLADIAMHFYKMDMRDYSNDVRANTAIGDTNPDENPGQHMTTHTLSFGIVGNISGPPEEWSEGQGWPTSISNNTPETLDDLIHAAYNGRGEYLSAMDITSLQASLQSVIDTIKQAAEGTGAAVGFNSTSIAEGSTLYQGKFNSTHWAGELFAYDYSTGDVGTLLWEASDQLDILVENSSRKIITYNGLTGVPFVAPSNYASLNLADGDLSIAQMADLLIGGPLADGEKQHYVEDVVEHLRGDGDGTLNAERSFRERESLLGDIVHSSPQFVGKPSHPYPNHIESSAAPYFSYVTDNAERTPIVYVGANDGMLHAFNADTGVEVFSYIPSAVFSTDVDAGLHHLASENYTHLPYVDATPTSADVYINGWKTYLVGGLAGGGKSIYVLDITDPASLTTESALASSVVVSEFSDETLGYTYSRPRIAKLNDGEWVAIFGNGYNNSTDGEAYLYVLYLDGFGPNGSAYQKIGPLGGDLGNVSGGDCENAGSDCNGLSSPTLLDLNGDSKLDRVYAGDLHGNMWAFDFTAYDNNNQYIEPVVAHRDDSDNGAPLFSACLGANPEGGYCAPSDRQPITLKPKVVAHESENGSSTKPNLMVLFGTGRYLASTDLTDTTQQAFYGVWDAGSNYGELRPADLTAQTLTDLAAGQRTVSTNAVDFVASTEELVDTNFGWYLNMAESRERVVIDPSVAGNLVLFVTTIPVSGVCNQAGTGNLIAVNMFTGARPPFEVFSSLGSNVASIPIGALPGGLVILGDRIIISDSNAHIRSIEGQFEHKRPTRRSAWSIRK